MYPSNYYQSPSSSYSSSSLAQTHSTSRTSSHYLRPTFSSPPTSAYVTRTHLPFAPQSTLVAHCIAGVQSSTRPYGTTTSYRTTSTSSGFSSLSSSSSGSLGALSRPVSIRSTESGMSSLTSRPSSTKRAPTVVVSSYIGSGSSSNSRPYSHSYYTSESPSSSYKYRTLTPSSSGRYLASSYTAAGSAKRSSHRSSYTPPSYTYRPVRLRERPVLTQIRHKLNDSKASSYSPVETIKRSEAQKDIQDEREERDTSVKDSEWSSDVTRNISRNKYLIKFREFDRRRSSTLPAPADTFGLEQQIDSGIVAALSEVSDENKIVSSNATEISQDSLVREEEMRILENPLDVEIATAEPVQNATKDLSTSLRSDAAIKSPTKEKKLRLKNEPSSSSCQERARVKTKEKVKNIIDNENQSSDIKKPLKAEIQSANKASTPKLVGPLKPKQPEDKPIDKSSEITVQKTILIESTDRIEPNNIIKTSKPIEPELKSHRPIEASVQKLPPPTTQRSTELPSQLQPVLKPPEPLKMKLKPVEKEIPKPVEIQVKNRTSKPDPVLSKDIPPQKVTEKSSVTKVSIEAETKVELIKPVKPKNIKLKLQPLKTKEIELAPSTTRSEDPQSNKKDDNFAKEAPSIPESPTKVKVKRLVKVPKKNLDISESKLDKQENKLQTKGLTSAESKSKVKNVISKESSANQATKESGTTKEDTMKSSTADQVSLLRPQESVKATKESESGSGAALAQSSPPVIRSGKDTRIRFRNYNLDDFNFLSVLGHGGWGFVILAELKQHDACFAVKCIKKITIVEDDDFESIMIERKVLLLGNINPFICKLFCTFETDGYLFFVMEFCPGGDLMFHVQREGKFSESRCRFYAAEIICAIRFLHNRHIIYRDLKLDNILLDSNGHVRLVDFGMCQCRTYREEMLPSNFCGTPEYISPEIIKGVPYNHSVDWWSFGVLLYEMAVGKMPFRGNDENELLWNVCYEKIHYPMFLSKELTNLLQLLLEREPTKRMGMSTCKAGDIKDQVWFRGVEWSAMEVMKVKPPFVPCVESTRDVQNFDADFTESKPELSPVDEGTLRRIDQKQFKTFPYTNPDIHIFDSLAS